MKVVTSKLFILLIMFILLLIAVSSVRGVIHDRLHFRDTALSSVSRGMAGAQVLAGPVLVMPYTEHYADEETVGSGEQAQRRRVARQIVHRVYVLPDSLLADGMLLPDPRRRGLFETAGYGFEGRLGGRFTLPTLPPVSTRTDGQMVAGTPFVLVEVSDTRGLRRIRMTLDGHEMKLRPGSGLDSARVGVHAPASDVRLLPGAQVGFDIELQIGGSQRFDLLPLGADTVLTLKSPWPHPSFVGRFLPEKRTVRADGFEARWQTSAFSTQARERWLACTGACPAQQTEADTLAVALVQPVDIYSLADRATKYGHLFIGLTFALFAVYELMKRLSIHPVQYLLVGLALAVFFLLLLALSEHLGFGAAYAVAASACVLLIAAYGAAVLRSLKAGALITTALGLLYGALYGILQSEQNALLLGSTLVFAVLAGVMLLTRNIDWHQVFGERGRGSMKGGREDVFSR